MLITLVGCVRRNIPGLYAVRKGFYVIYLAEFHCFCSLLFFPALFLPETFINRITIFAALMPYSRHFGALSNLIYPFASPLYIVVIARSFRSQNFLIFDRRETQVMDIKK